MIPKYSRSPKDWEREKERKEREGQERYKNNSVLHFDVKYYSQLERQFVNVSGKKTLASDLKWERLEENVCAAWELACNSITDPSNSL